MKHILITGEHGYIGNSLVSYLSEFEDDYHINRISLRDNSWKDADFSKYDVVVHLAAIVHRPETADDVYYRVNRDLAFELAQKAQKSGVKQFIFMSTMAVYGVSSGVITGGTEPSPKNAYGKSKLEAELMIQKLNNPQFLVSIIRPPMVYGPNGVGNYVRLAKIAKKLVLFPRVRNKRSMIYVKNLTSFLKIVIDNRLVGIFHPQNSEYVNTTQLVKVIAECHSKKVILIPGIGGILSLFSNRISVLNKVFGSLYYDHDIDYRKLDQPLQEYQIVNFADSILETEIEK